MNKWTQILRSRTLSCEAGIVLLILCASGLGHDIFCDSILLQFLDKKKTSAGDMVPTQSSLLVRKNTFPIASREVASLVRHQPLGSLICVAGSWEPDTSEHQQNWVSEHRKVAGTPRSCHLQSLVTAAWWQMPFRILFLGLRNSEASVTEAA